MYNCIVIILYLIQIIDLNLNNIITRSCIIQCNCNKKKFVLNDFFFFKYISKFLLKNVFFEKFFTIIFL